MCFNGLLSVSPQMTSTSFVRCVSKNFSFLCLVWLEYFILLYFITGCLLIYRNIDIYILILYPATLLNFLNSCISLQNLLDFLLRICHLQIRTTLSFPFWFIRFYFLFLPCNLAKTPYRMLTGHSNRWCSWFASDGNGKAPIILPLRGMLTVGFC